MTQSKMSTLWSRLWTTNKIISEQIRIGLANENMKIRKENTWNKIVATKNIMFSKYLFISNVSISVILSATGKFYVGKFNY